MAGKAEYCSARRSRRLIREAFLKLLEQKDYNKISVTDIVTLADINRATFYAHYPDVRGLLEEIENEIIGAMKEILSRLEYHAFFANPAPLLLEVSRYLENDEAFYRTLIRSNGADPFLEKLKQVFTQFMLEDTNIPQELRGSREFRLRVCFFAGGIANIYRQYFWGQLDCSLSDISVEVGRMVAAFSKEAVNGG